MRTITPNVDFRIEANSIKNEQHLNVAFTYPLKVMLPECMKLSRVEKCMIQRAKSILKQTNLNTFYISFLMPDQQHDLRNLK